MHIPGSARLVALAAVALVGAAHAADLSAAGVPHNTAVPGNCASLTSFPVTVEEIQKIDGPCLAAMSEGVFMAMPTTFPDKITADMWKALDQTRLDKIVFTGAFIAQKLIGPGHYVSLAELFKAFPNQDLSTLDMSGYVPYIGSMLQKVDKSLISQFGRLFTAKLMSVLTADECKRIEPKLVSKMPVDAFSAIKEKCFGAIPASTFAAITPEQWAAINAPAMKSLTLPQVQKVKPETIHALTDKQAENFGPDYTMPDSAEASSEDPAERKGARQAMAKFMSSVRNHPCKNASKMYKNLEKEIGEVLQARCAAIDNGAARVSGTGVLLCGALAITYLVI